MRIELAYVSPRKERLKSGPAQALVDEYLKRAGRYTPAQAVAYETETAFLHTVERGGSRTPVTLVLLDSRGQALKSEEIAQRVASFRDRGAQRLTFAVGPADGWSKAATERADLRLAFGAITLPHELALVVAAEQIYRALTILAGHPYHGGHS
jgi:23S rRNA (pseudouridine1915-N3)-methyltransferase